MLVFHFFFQAEDGIRDFHVTGVQTCALPILVKLLAFIAARIVGFLVEDSVNSDGSLAGLAVADDQLALAAPNRNQAVNGLEAGRSEERRVGKECRGRWSARQ